MMEKYLTIYGNSSFVFPCFYNPEEPWSVVRVKGNRKTRVVHAFLWATLALVAGALALLFLWFCKCKDTVEKRPKQRDKETTSGDFSDSGML